MRRSGLVVSCPATWPETTMPSRETVIGPLKAADLSGACWARSTIWAAVSGGVTSGTLHAVKDSKHNAHEKSTVATRGRRRGRRRSTNDRSLKRPTAASQWGRRQAVSVPPAITRSMSTTQAMGIRWGPSPLDPPAGHCKVVADEGALHRGGARRGWRSSAPRLPPNLPIGDLRRLFQHAPWFVRLFH